MTPNTYRVTSDNGNNTYVKLHSEGGVFGYGDVNTEAYSYNILRPYLNMPHIRKIEVDGNPLLFIKEVEGVSVHDLIKQGEVFVATNTLNLLIKNLESMWKMTTKNLDGQLLSVNVFERSLKMLSKICEANIGEIGFINGE